MRRGALRLMAAPAVVLLLAAGAAAVDYDDRANGNWDAGATWETNDGTYPDGTDDTATVDGHNVTVTHNIGPLGTVTVAGGTLKVGLDQTGAGPSAVAATGGTLRLERAVDWDNDPTLTLDGGTLYVYGFSSGAMRWDDPVRVASESTLYLAGLGARINGPITGSGTMHVSAYRYTLTLGGDNSGFTGDIEIVGAFRDGSWSGTLIAGHARALGGCRNITIEGVTSGDEAESGILRIEAQPDASVAPQAIRVLPHGVFDSHTFDTGWDVELAGGTFMGGHYSGALTHTGDLTITGAGTVALNSGHLTIAGRISGGGKLACTGATDRKASVTLAHADNTFAGGLDVVGDSFKSGYGVKAAQAPEGAAAGSLGGGPIHLIGADARLMLDDADGPADWALANRLVGSGVIVVEDGSGARTLTVAGAGITPGYYAAGGFDERLRIDGRAAFQGHVALAVDLAPVYGTPTATVPDEVRNRSLRVDHEAVGLSALHPHVTIAGGTLTLADIGGMRFTVLTCGSDIVTAGERLGAPTFDAFDGYDLGGPVEYGYDAGSGTGTVTVEVTVRADANMSLNVDVLDLARLANNFGKTNAGWRDADFNYDGVVDVLDLAAIANNFGVDASGADGGGGGNVPEPASAAVLGLGALALIRRRRRSG